MRFKDYLRLIKNETSLEDFRNKARNFRGQRGWLSVCVVVFWRETFIKWKGNDGITTVENGNKIWLVVSKIFYFHPYLGKIPNLTNIFQRGWNHQQEIYCIRELLRTSHLFRVFLYLTPPILYAAQYTKKYLPGIPTTIKTMGVNITIIAYISRVLIIETGSTIILKVVEAQGFVIVYDD